MSGEGALDRLVDNTLAFGRGEERDDVIAYLEQRRDNAQLMAQRSPEHADQARERERQLTVMIEEFSAGLHVGAAIARDALQRWAEPPKAELSIELDHAAMMSATIETNTFNQEPADGIEAEA